MRNGAPLPILCLLFLSFSCLAAETPARLFFSDANLSFTFPPGWQLDDSFPYGPLFKQKLADGTTALIECRASAPLMQDKVVSDLPAADLEPLALQIFQAARPSAKVLSRRSETLAGHHALGLTWQEPNREGRTDLFFNENRMYALNLQTPSGDLVSISSSVYNAWLQDLRILSRRDAGNLNDPAHGGLWIHQTGGAKVRLPSAWLIGVSDDRNLGAAYASGEKQASFTAAVEVNQRAAEPVSERDKKEARAAVLKQGVEVRSESEEPFHGLPAFQLEYEGKQGGRFVRGIDLWVASRRGRWLFNFEADGSLFVELSPELRDILNNIEFLDEPAAPKP